MANIIKDSVSRLVKEKVESLSGLNLVWPDHAIPFLGQVAGGTGEIEVRDIDASETFLIMKTPGGTRWFRVKVTEMY